MNLSQEQIESLKAQAGQPTDIKKVIKTSIEVVNNTTQSLGIRNIVGESRKKLEQTREEMLSHLVDVVATGIQTGILTSDEHNILIGKTKKVFKDEGRINAMLKKIITQKTSLEKDKILNGVEVAKMVSKPSYISVDEATKLIKFDTSCFDENGQLKVTPEQVPTPNDDTVVEIHSNHANDAGIIIDKANGIAYIEVGSQWVAKKLKQTESWYSSAVDLLTFSFGFVWNLFLKMAKELLRLAITAIVALIAGVQALGTTVSNKAKSVKDTIFGWFKKDKTEPKAETEVKSEPETESVEPDEVIPATTA